jgi:hypothetical protein
VRQVDTAVEMKAGQTFALAGLVQERTDTIKRGLPYVSDLPVVGLPFRKMEDEVNEIELLILVTPEFVDPIDACEMPCGGPGTFTTSPTSRGLYCGGKVEVPTYCNPIQGMSACGGDDCGGSNCGNGGCSTCNNGGAMNAAPMPIFNGNSAVQGGSGYDDTTTLPAMTPDLQPASVAPAPAIVPDQAPQAPAQPGPAATPIPPQGARAVPDDITLPVVTDQPQIPANPIRGTTPAVPVAAPLPSAPDPSQGPASTSEGAYYPVGPTNPAYTAPRPYSPQRQPVFLRNASRPYIPQPANAQPTTPKSESGLIGPVGYDVQ